MAVKQVNDKIRNILRVKSITVKEFCKKIGITENGFSKAIKNNSLRVETIIKISEVLDVPVSYFFTDSENVPTGNNEEIQGLKAEIFNLKTELLENRKEIERNADFIRTQTIDLQIYNTTLNRLHFIIYYLLSKHLKEKSINEFFNIKSIKDLFDDDFKYKYSKGIKNVLDNEEPIIIQLEEQSFSVNGFVDAITIYLLKTTYNDLELFFKKLPTGQNDK